LLVAVALVAACSPSAPPAATPVPATAAPATKAPASEPAPTEAASEAPVSDAPSDAAGAAPDRYAPGTTVIVSKDDVDFVEITVSDVATAESYEGDVLADEPQTPGNVFIQAYVDYTAIADDTAYNALDWTLLVDGVEQTSFTFLLNGPEPTLGSGTLAAGESAGGWLVYEVPAEGEVVIQWGDILVFQDGPVFEIVLRA
jgi:hypothetical protein